MFKVPPLSPRLTRTDLISGKPARASVLFALLPCLLLAGAVLAQDGQQPAVASQTEVLTQTGAQEQPASESGTGEGDVALGSFGISAGFPGYQVVAVSAAVQYRSFGLATRGSFTAAGPYLGLAVRGYPPIPSPVPLFVSAGMGFYGDSRALELTAGAHVPIAENFRLNLEAGAARVTTLGEAQWLPVISAGVSYAVPFIPSEVAPATAGSTLRRTTSGAMDCNAPPSRDSLESAFRRTLQRFIANGRATYAGTYTDLSYDYSITDVTMSGNDGSVSISYSGSVRTILGGQTESASGTASASFRWNGCSWSRTSMDY
jgi:hypothetical protein